SGGGAAGRVDRFAHEVDELGEQRLAELGGRPVRVHEHAADQRQPVDVARPAVAGRVAGDDVGVVRPQGGARDREAGGAVNAVEQGVGAGVGPGQRLPGVGDGEADDVGVGRLEEPDGGQGGGDRRL